MKVVEKFISINGEGRRTGELAVFIRFKGCNLIAPTVIQSGPMSQLVIMRSCHQMRFVNMSVRQALKM